MMINYNDYTTFLSNVMNTRIIGFSIALLIASPIIIWMCIRNKEWAVRSIFIGLGICLICGAFIAIFPYAKDLSCDPFITYSGNYTVNEITFEQSQGYFAHIYLDDGTKLELSLKACKSDPKTGTYSGCIVYSKHTNILFYWDSSKE